MRTKETEFSDSKEPFATVSLTWLLSSPNQNVRDTIISDNSDRFFSLKEWKEALLILENSGEGDRVLRFKQLLANNRP